MTRLRASSSYSEHTIVQRLSALEDIYDKWGLDFLGNNPVIQLFGEDRAKVGGDTLKRLNLLAEKVSRQKPRHHCQTGRDEEEEETWTSKWPAVDH